MSEDKDLGHNPDEGDWETPCPKREDGIHCTCWYDGGKCCGCSDGQNFEESKGDQSERGPHPTWG